MKVLRFIQFFMLQFTATLFLFFLAACTASQNKENSTQVVNNFDGSVLKNYQPHHGAIPLKPIKTGLIVIIIDDMGINQPQSRRAVMLPPAITLSYLPYAAKLDQQLAMALAARHKVMLHLPMEPHNKDSPFYQETPNILQVGMTKQRMADIFAEAIQKIPQAIAVNNHMGSKFTEWEEGMEHVLGFIYDRQLIFIDSKTSANSVAKKIARISNWPLIERDVFIDHEADQLTINRQLRRIEEIAITKGFAVAIGHPTPLTLSSLENWLPTLENKNLRIISLTDLITQHALKAQR